MRLEIQLADDKDMPRRKLYYALLIENKYKVFPRQMVLYLGDETYITSNHIKNKNLSYQSL